MGKRTVHIKRLNWDAEMYQDIITGRGFIITEPGQISIDGSKKKTMNGPQSPRYGTTYGDEQEFIERCRCDCGRFKGVMFEGETCPFCKSKVQKREVDIKMCGWINFGKKKFINPYYYQILSKLIGKKELPDILDTKQRVDKNGNIKPVPKDKLQNPLSPYSGFGIKDFMINFDDIMNYFQAKKKNKFDDFEAMKRIKTHVFTSNVPVYTTVLRPQSSTSDTLYYTGIDKEINPLVRLSSNIENCEDIEEPIILSYIQARVNKMWEYNFDLITTKYGFIRGSLLGGSLNFSARNVIIPSPELKDDEIDVSYHTFRIVFKYEIIYYLMRQDQIPLSKAYNRWKRSFIFDNYVYEIMKFIVEHKHPMMLINRNPTLNFYSMLLMKIRSVKRTDEDYTLSVGLSILPGLNADQLEVCA